jgi:hypothetical protein
MPFPSPAGRPPDQGAPPAQLALVAATVTDRCDTGCWGDGAVITS